MINVKISFVDGSFHEFEEDNRFGEELIELQEQGYEGRELIHALLSDDWGPQPTFVMIKRTLANGKNSDISIPYR